MSTVGFATLDVIPSVRGLRAELEKQTGGDLARAGKVGGKNFGDSAGKEAAGRFRGHLATATDDIKKALTSPLAVGAIGTGIVLGFKNVVGAASDAQQAIGGVEAVFGEYAAGVLSDAKKADQALGLSATAYEELITLSGALLKNKGIEDFAAQGETLIKVGADLAAQFGGSTREAVEALNAAMRGESDPIERYAISLNETAINAELARTGMADLEGAALDQAKTQARLTLIQKQSADAQGAFGRESDTAAGQAARATAQFADMRQELGEKLLPATSAFIGFLNDEALPALGAAGGVAQDVGAAIGDLPTPVKAAAAAFVALRTASAVGLSDGIASTASSAKGAIDSLRIRTMLAGDEFKRTRTITREFAGTTAQVSSGVGRATASLNALRVGASGAGAAIRSGIGGAAGMLGGPWGIAIIAATALLGKFWSEQQKAKAEVEKFTATLDTNTAALTENTRETAKAALEAAGAFKAAQTLGISLTDVTDAALGNADAIARVRERYAELNATDLNTEQAKAMQTLGTSVRDTTTAIDGARASQQRLIAAGDGAAESTDRSAAATEGATDDLVTYARAIDQARGELKNLMAVEKERALKAIQNRRDQIALRETLAAAREEAADGKRTLNENTAAGRENISALLDLADQFANSTPKVTNAKGAYEDMRRKFIEVATSMGATKEEAKNLADELIKVPKTAPLKFQSKGYQETMAEIAAIKAAAAQLGSASVDFTPRGFGTPDGRPSPAPPPSATLAPNATDPRAGVVFDQRGSTIVAHDYDDFVRQSGRKAQAAGLGGRPTTP